MSEYDDTNTGAAFPPWESEKMVLTGKLNIEGRENDLMIVATTTKNGKKMLKLFNKIGVMFEDEDPINNKPHYSGPLDDKPHLKIAGWKQEKDDKKYLQLRISPKLQGNTEQPLNNRITADIDDEIPF